MDACEGGTDEKNITLERKRETDPWVLQDISDGKVKVGRDGRRRGGDKMKEKNERKEDLKIKKGREEQNDKKDEKIAIREEAVKKEKRKRRRGH